MTLQQIKYAIAIYETGQFSKAAEKLYVTQPSLTKAMNELEKELATTIFIRNRKGITVTEEGEEFITYARQFYAQYEILADRFKNKNRIKKKFGVSCHHYSFAVKAFMETIRNFNSPQYEFAIREAKTYEIIHDVSTLKSEIGIIFKNDFNEKFIDKILKEHELVFHKLMDCEPYIFVCRDHPLVGKKSVAFEELDPYPCFIFEQGDSEPYFFAEEILPLSNYSRTVKTRDKLTMLNMIAEMNGYTLCTGMIYDKLNGKEYVSIPFKADCENSTGKIQIGYIYKNTRMFSEIGELYLKNIKKYLKEYENPVVPDSK